MLHECEQKKGEKKERARQRAYGVSSVVVEDQRQHEEYGMMERQLPEDFRRSGSCQLISHVNDKPFIRALRV
jgi:hypothetical protein